MTTWLPLPIPTIRSAKTEMLRAVLSIPQKLKATTRFVLRNPLLIWQANFSSLNPEIETKLDLIKTTLFNARAERPRPHLDDKIITSWNGLAISALSQAAQTLGKPKYARVATEAAHFIKSNLFNAENGQLIRLYRNAPPLWKHFPMTTLT